MGRRREKKEKEFARAHLASFGKSTLIERDLLPTAKEARLVLFHRLLGLFGEAGR